MEQTQGHTADRWQAWDLNPNLPQSPYALTPACSPSGGMEVRRQVVSEKCVPCEKIATQQDGKEPLTLRTGMPWGPQAQRAAAAHIS